MTIRLEPTRNVRVRTTSGDVGFEGKLAKGASVDAGDSEWASSLSRRGFLRGGLDYEVTTFSGDIPQLHGRRSPARQQVMGLAAV